MQMKNFLIGLLSTVLLLYTSYVYSEGSGGLNNPVYGARALGQANAVVARPQGPSTTQFNPAGLTELDGTQASFGLTLHFPSTEYYGPLGKEHMEEGILYTPNFFISSDLGMEKMAVGLGITAPYGLRTEWSKTGFARYVATASEMSLVNINPTVAFKINDHLSIGLGLDYYTSSSTLERQNNWPFTTPDGSSQIKVHGDGWGFNLGLLAKLNEKHSVGLSFRSKAHLNLKGHLNLTNITGPVAGIFGGSTFHTDLTSDLTLPEMVVLGYAYQVNDHLSLEADIQWTNWSRFEKMAVKFDNTNFILEADNPVWRRWRDVLSLGVGMEYQLNDRTQLRTGYFYYESPVPESTFDPSIPGSDRHGVTLGVGYEWDSITIDFAYAAIFVEDRHITNTVGSTSGASVSGKYESFIHLVALTFTYRF